ncbi:MULTISPECIES: M20/M25/M40 family metallo-hydrolase [Kordiimonas]|jgi:carboxypeptidase PM20D1|uniref:M20/M25/M40 family metallo-hydrolase n=1 Tax=Kordiimonas TaxID=288021 RepID=UPI00257F36E9|nr:M20/M25/M40 family metallo-hydrolase [Kordiimonas sp. UBA4487]
MRILGYLVVGLVGLIIFMVANTVATLPAGEAKSLKPASYDAADARRMAENLAGAVRFQTISHSLDRAPDHKAFKGFHDYLVTTYPNAHAVLEREVVSDYSLMYRWPATTDTGKKPIALAAHIDVVPVPETGLADWPQPPFAGVIDDNGILWGRGTLDDKGMLIAIMEALEKLARAGFTPDRDIYFLFGHDEELGGDKGAAVMAGILKDRGVQLAWLMDEGSAIPDGIIPGVKSPVALISLGEKGSVTLRFSATDDGGHSSAPKDYTAASLAAKAGVLVTENQYPLVLDEHLESFLKAVAPEQPFLNRFMIANLWATRGVMAGELAKSPTVAAFMHTTTAFTMMKSGTKTNILPQYAEAVVNYRIHPRDTVEGVVARATELIGDDRVTVLKMGDGREATSMSDPSGEGYQAIVAAVKAEFGDIPIAPTLTVQGTDARHYGGVADGVYRFMPLVVGKDTLKQIHGTAEHISIEALARQVSFFETLIRGTAE